MLDNKGFDLWAEEYDRDVRASDEAGEYPFAGYAQIMAEIDALITNKEKAKVLDIGIGTGFLAGKLTLGGAELWGVDFSREMIERTQKRLPKAKLFVADITKGLPEEVKKEKFDFIVSTYALHHLDEDQKAEFIILMMKLLKADGQIFVGDVSFLSVAAYKRCKEQAGDKFDTSEHYSIAPDLLHRLKGISGYYTQISDCAGIYVFTKG